MKKIICFLLCLGLVAGSSYAQCTGCTLSNNSATQTFNLKSGDVLCINGNFTGKISTFPAGATICVAPGATFDPSEFANDAAGKINAYGRVKFGTLTLGKGFQLNNYGVLSLSNLNANGTINVVNQAAGSMHVTSSYSLSSNSTLINYGKLYFASDFNTNSGSTFTNQAGARFYTEGSFNPSGTVNNYGYGRAKGFININSGAAFTNYCSYVSDRGFNNNSDATKNYGFWLGLSSASSINKIENNNKFYNGPKAFIQGVAFTNGSQITGGGTFVFSGVTTNQGSFGADGGKINFHDKGKPSRVMDVESTPVHSSVTKFPVTSIDTNVLKSNCNSDAINIVLPVNLIDFSVIKSDKTVAEVKWSAANEVGFKHYEVEYSSNGKDFTTKAFVLPLANNGGINVYQHKLSLPTGSNHYFRLKMVDADLTVKYSAVSVLTAEPSEKGFAIQKNPATTETTISFKKIPNAPVLIELVNTNGQVVYKTQIKAAASFQLKELNKFTPGLYFVRVSGQGVLQIEKLMIQ